MEITGTIKLINDTEVISDKYKKRTFVITTTDKYPQDIQFQASQDKVDILNGFKAGQSVTVSFNLRGREYNGKYYNSLETWKISFAQATPEQTQSLNDLF
jgi:hypothetical protein